MKNGHPNLSGQIAFQREWPCPISPPVRTCWWFLVFPLIRLIMCKLSWCVYMSAWSCEHQIVCLLWPHWDSLDSRTPSSDVSPGSLFLLLIQRMQGTVFLPPELCPCGASHWGGVMGCLVQRYTVLMISIHINICLHSCLQLFHQLHFPLLFLFFPHCILLLQVEETCVRMCRHEYLCVRVPVYAWVHVCMSASMCMNACVVECMSECVCVCVHECMCPSVCACVYLCDEQLTFTNVGR